MNMAGLMSKNVLSLTSCSYCHWANISYRCLVGSRPLQQQHIHMHSRQSHHNNQVSITSQSLPLVVSVKTIQNKNIIVLPVSNFSSTITSHSSDKHVPFTSNSGNTEENEAQGQPLHSFGSSHKREQASNRFDVQNSTDSDSNQRPAKSDYQPDLASAHHADVYNHTPSVNLSACMQSQVPEPYGTTPSHMNMPGGVNRREDKYVQGRLSDMSGNREFSTLSKQFATYSLDEHGSLTYNTERLDQMLREPCPQGIQGEDCEQFKIWLSNCMEYGSYPECEKLANEYMAGRKTLAQLFNDYDTEIKQAAIKLKQQKVGNAEHVLMSANSGAQKSPSSHGSQPPPPSHGSPPPPPQNDENKMSAKDTRIARLKAAVKDYGSIVIVFHVGISLASLGFFYTLVASNVDVVSILNYFNISLGSAESSVGTASTFAVAYAVHKIFAPIRIGITLSCVPFIVRSLRVRGILKTPPPRP